MVKFAGKVYSGILEDFNADHAKLGNFGIFSTIRAKADGDKITDSEITQLEDFRRKVKLERNNIIASIDASSLSDPEKADAKALLTEICDVSVRDSITSDTGLGTVNTRKIARDVGEMTPWALVALGAVQGKPITSTLGWAALFFVLNKIGAFEGLGDTIQGITGGIQSGTYGKTETSYLASNDTTKTETFQRGAHDVKIDMDLGAPLKGLDTGKSAGFDRSHVG